ncbi:hypothetical protein S83_014215 [Arachis hypogaea]|nr:uncharacterized protein DS421_14g483590 [Arachis hypogaea]
MEEESDPFHFLFNFYENSSSQEQLLQSIPFCGQAAVTVADGGGSTQEQHDVYHTPPENSLVSSSNHQPRQVEFVDLDDYDSEESECVNLDSGSALGFPKVEPGGIKRNAVDERELRSDELQVEKPKLLEPPSGKTDNVKKRKSSLVFDVLRTLAEAEKAQKAQKASATATDAGVDAARLFEILAGKRRG